MKTSKIVIYLFAVFTIVSCKKDNLESIENKSNPYSCAYSIIVNQNKVLISGYLSTDSKLRSKYWIDSSSADSVAFINSIDNGITYKEPVDELFRKVIIHKTLNGELDVYKFNQGTMFKDEGIFYYINNEIVRMETSAPGTIASVCFLGDKPFFAGYFSEKGYYESGETFFPKTPFFWDGNSSLIYLPLPDGVFFGGINCVYVDEEVYYIGGLTDFPMYWKNNELVKLSNLYGEVQQIVVSESDVYAVGFYNKGNSNSTGHTACYWKNKELFELEDNAQAYGIYVDGSDIYISGASGNVPSQYKACYWKNGIKTYLLN